MFHQTSPYWYLYCLFFVFFVTTTFKGMKHTITGLVIAVVMKLMSIMGRGGIAYAISTVLTNVIWLVIGMILCIADVPKRIIHTKIFLCSGIVFVLLSIVIAVTETELVGMSFLMKLLACASVVGYYIAVDNKEKTNCFMAYLSNYTMLIFLMLLHFCSNTEERIDKIGCHLGVNTYTSWKCY